MGIPWRKGCGVVMGYVMIMGCEWVPEEEPILQLYSVCVFKGINSCDVGYD